MKIITSINLHTLTYVQRVPDSKKQIAKSAIATVTTSKNNNSNTSYPFSEYSYLTPI
jgi:hypothetical protein